MNRGAAVLPHQAAAGRFRALTEAYRVLSGPGRRAAYDRALGRGQAAPGMPPAVPVRRPGPGGVTGPPLCRGRRCGSARSGWTACAGGRPTARAKTR